MSVNASGTATPGEISVEASPAPWLVYLPTFQFRYSLLDQL